MAISAWSEAVPSGSSAVGQFPNYARSVWAAISTGMAVEHLWNASGGGSEASAGDLRPGGSRAFFDVQSQSSAPGSQQTGRLFFASDASRLFVYDSTGTYLAATAFFEEHATNAGSGYWLRQSGQTTISTGTGTLSITFPVPYLVTPLVYFTDYCDAGVRAGTLVGASVTPTGFTSSWSQTRGPSNASLVWESLGTAASANY